MKQKQNPADLIVTLDRLVNELIGAVLAVGVKGMYEGDVMCSGPAPYRRIDCDGRALAYIRARPRKKAVRVDITGLWKAPPSASIRVPNACGAASLLLKSEVEVYEAARFLVATVDRTRRQQAKKALRADAA